MPQVTGNAAAGIGGMQLANGIAGPLVHLWGSGDPNALTDSSVTNAAVGSLYSRIDGGASTSLYVKEAMPNTWAAK